MDNKTLEWLRVGISLAGLSLRLGEAVGLTLSRIVPQEKENPLPEELLAWIHEEHLRLDVRAAAVLADAEELRENKSG